MLGQRHWLPYPAELPGGAASGGATGPGANLLALLALLDNNVQNVGPVSATADTVYYDSAPYTLLPSPVPGNATVDVKGSISVSGTSGDVVTFELVRDRGTASAQVLATQESAISPTTGLAFSGTLAFLDTNVGTFPAGFVPITEQSTHTYSIVATSAAALTGLQPASLIMEQLPSGTTATVGSSPPSGGFLAGTSLLNFAAFGGAGISRVPGDTSSVTGSIGLGPGVTSTAFTGFSQTLPAGAPAFGQYATAPIVHADGATTTPYSLTGAGEYVSPPPDQGVLYAADYAVPTPANVNTSNNDMLAAYTSASSQIVPPANLNLSGGTITATNGPSAGAYVPGVYKWTTPVTATGMTLNGAGIYVFIITGTFDLESAAAMVLEGGAIPSQVFFAIAGAVTLHTTSVAFGEFLAKTNIAMLPGATLTGRALAQTGITLSSATIIEA